VLPKLLGSGRFRFEPKGRGAWRYYEISVLPSLDAFFAAVGEGKIAMASPTGITPFTVTGSVGRAVV